MSEFCLSTTTRDHN